MKRWLCCDMTVHGFFWTFWEIFGTDEIGKNYVILGKNTTTLEKNSAILSNIGKIYLLNWDFSANWECSRSIRNFFSQLGKIWYRKPDPVLYREKALQYMCSHKNKTFEIECPNSTCNRYSDIGTINISTTKVEIWAALWENQQCGFRTGPTQIGLYSHRSRLEAWNFGVK